jgi:hypothetical protein
LSENETSENADMQHERQAWKSGRGKDTWAGRSGVAIDVKGEMLFFTTRETGVEERER